MRDSIIESGYQSAQGHYSEADSKALAFQDRERQARLDRGFADGQPFKDQIVGRMRFFSDGGVNFYGYPQSVRYRLDELRARPRAKRGESENPEQSRIASIKRARKNVRLRSQEISADRLLTLTYRGVMDDPERLKRDFDAFRRGMKRYGLNHYVAVIERHQHGGFHIHMAVHGRQVYNIVRGVWWHIVGRGMGNIDVKNPRTGGKWKRHALAGYLAKYIGKGFGDAELNKKKYWTSRGISIPEPQTYLVAAMGSMHDVLVDAMRAAMSVCPAHQIQAYVSPGGYFFVSASPGA